MTNWQALINNKKILNHESMKYVKIILIDDENCIEDHQWQPHASTTMLGSVFCVAVLLLSM